MCIRYHELVSSCVGFSDWHRFGTGEMNARSPGYNQLLQQDHFQLKQALRMPTSRWIIASSLQMSPASEPNGDDKAKREWKSGYIFVDKKKDNGRNPRRNDPWWMRDEVTLESMTFASPSIHSFIHSFISFMCFSHPRKETILGC